MSVCTDVLCAAIASLALSASEEIMSGPGMICAFTMCAQRAMVCTPPEYCRCTVPIQDIISQRLDMEIVVPHTTYISKLAILEYDKLLSLCDLSQASYGLM